MAARETHFGEGPAACPFVALDSDRDRRLDEPDHRHRCYAEPEPAPRAIAHQRAYCLSPNFPGCPIFQDWAVRAAARPAASGGATAGAAGYAAADVSRGADEALDERPGGARPDYLDEDVDALLAKPAPAWAAPPPWVGREDAGPAEPEQIGAFDDAPAFDEPAAHDEPSTSSPTTGDHRPEREFPPAGSWPPAATPSAASLAQSSPEEIERLPSLPVDPSGDPVRDAEIEAERRRRLEQDRERRAEDERLRRAEDERRERERRAAAAAAIPPFLAGRASAEGAPAGGPAASPPRAPQRSGPPEASSSAPHAMAAPQVKREDLVPVWEREPIHAYPTLRSRFSMGGGSSDVLGTLTGVLALLALLALVAFLVIAAPVLFGGGGPGRTQQPGAVATPTSAAGQSVAPGATATPQPPAPTATAVAGPTPRTYTVRAGDTLFGIAEEFGLTVEQLLAANPDIVDANYVIVGQVVVIPDSGSVPPGSTAAPATPAP